MKEGRSTVGETGVEVGGLSEGGGGKSGRATSLVSSSSCSSIVSATDQSWLTLANLGADVSKMLSSRNPSALGRSTAASTVCRRSVDVGDEIVTRGWSADVGREVSTREASVKEDSGLGMAAWSLLRKEATSWLLCPEEVEESPSEPNDALASPLLSPSDSARLLDPSWSSSSSSPASAKRAMLGGVVCRVEAEKRTLMPVPGVPGGLRIALTAEETQCNVGDSARRAGVGVGGGGGLPMRGEGQRERGEKWTWGGGGGGREVETRWRGGESRSMRRTVEELPLACVYPSPPASRVSEPPSGDADPSSS